MKLFDEHCLLRILLIVVGSLFSVFMDELIAFEEHPYWIIPYCASISFLFFTALFYRFPPSISLNRMRKDLEVPMPSMGGDGFSKVDDLRRSLEEKETLLKMFFTSSSDGFWILDLPTGKVQWSARVAELFGISLDKLGSSFDALKTLVFESDWAKFTKMLKIALESKQKFSLEIRPVLGKNIIVVTGTPQMNEEGRPIRMFGSFVPKADILSFKNPFFLDELTGLKNRRYFLEHLKEKVNYAQLHQDYSFALILIDIDHFGRINDVYSPQFGDCVLKLIAERIVSSCQQQDCVARISGDIFAILLHDVNGKDKGKMVEFAQNLHSKIRQPLQLEGKELLIGASMSVILNNDLDASDDLMSHATTLLRNLKSGDCRGNIQFFSGGLREKAMQVYQLEYELRKAIQAKVFTLVYQPVIDVSKDNKVVSFEALVRWNNSERGMIPPSEFIPIAEETGLIVPLGELILRGACRQAKEWVDLGYADLKIAVNFSAKQFSQGDLVHTLQSILQETGLNPKNLKMEITEYTVMNDTKKTVEMMRQLTAMGVEISIDDFGTGFSSLSYLKNFPVHTLKIDKSFVDSLLEKEEDAVFIRTIIGIAKSLNLELIAEGVETKEQLEFLRNEGCFMIQGYYFSKPLPPTEVLDFLQKKINTSFLKQLA